jgi:hypothetical protein
MQGMKEKSNKDKEALEKINWNSRNKSGVEKLSWNPDQYLGSIWRLTIKAWTQGRRIKTLR